MFEVCVKSGTSGYYDYDGCDMVVAEIRSDNIPHKNDVLEITDKDLKHEKYLVTEVNRHYSLVNNRETITVYVIGIK